MSDISKIEWTDSTWNVITGCSVVSPGCTNCYAMGLAGTRLRNHPSRAGLTDESKAGPVWNGKVRLNEDWLTQPLKWRRPRTIFVCAHGDLFHQNVPDEWIDRVFRVINMTPHHTYQILTKRARRMRQYMSDQERVVQVAFEGRAEWPPRNAWLGVSAEDQTRADERVPDLLATPAAVRFVSAEPLLGPIDFGAISNGWYFVNALKGTMYHDNPPDEPAAPTKDCARLNWVIVGGESGSNARPMHPAWARSIRDQCAAAGVAFFFKQWGEWAVDKLSAGGDLGGDMRRDVVRHVCADRENDGHFRKGDRHMRRVGKARAGRLLDGQTHDDMPQRSA